jgi:hypothetical protein
MGKQVYEVAKKAYMAEHGISEEPDDKELKKKFEEKVRQYVVNVARSVDRSVETYEHAIAKILEAPKPIHGADERERSKILDALVSQYAINSHEGSSKQTKGKSVRRYRHLENELGTTYHTEHWKGKYSNILKDAIGKDAKFADSAMAPDVMKTVGDLLRGKKPNPRAAYLDVEGPYDFQGLQKLEKYRKAA